MDGTNQPMSSDMKQDEYLISPVVDLTGLNPLLTFDYAFFRYGIMNGYMTLTVEVSTDGGNTWTPIWNAKEDLENPGGSYLMGTVELAIPAEYLTNNVQFAFHAYKKAGTGYTDSDITIAIDNVKLAVPADPCAGGHTLEAVAAVAPTCTEDGVVAHWKCSVCGALFADAEGNTSMTEEETVDPANGHNFTEQVVGDNTLRSVATHHESASYWHSCACGAVSDSSWFANGQPLPYQVSGDSEWTKGSNNGMDVVTDGEADWFAGVQVDGKDLSEGAFALDKETMTITVNAAFLETLSVGDHTLTLLFTDGSVSKVFTVNPPSEIPDTGDTMRMMLLAPSVMLMTLCAMLALFYIHRRKQR